MNVIIEGCNPENNSKLAVAGTCTQEPGDNCWLHLD